MIVLPPGVERDEVVSISVLVGDVWMELEEKIPEDPFSERNDDVKEMVS